jgi:hypothetical protein
MKLTKIWKTSEKTIKQKSWKSSLNQIQNSDESNSRRLEKVENGTSGLEDIIDFKEKTEESIEKRLKNCERNT